jgi:hypothetical protein
MLIKGTILLVADEMRLSPPDDTDIIRIAHRIPVMIGLTFSISRQTPTIAFTWIRHPIESEFTRQSVAKAKLKNLPIHGIPRSVSTSFIYSALDEAAPSFLRERARSVSAYFSTEASTADTHIQKTAPAPPYHIAAETPTMFPTPSTPPRASQRADLGETEPSFISFRKKGEIIARGRIIGKPFIYIMKKNPVPIKSAGKRRPKIRELI